MTLVPYERAWVALQNPASELANAIANTDFVPKGLRGNPAAITAAILYGDEVGLGPMQSLAKVHVIDGRPALASEAQRALILQAGHDLWIEESTNSKCTVGGRRRDSDQVSRVTWTLDDAKRANLAGRPNWRTYPRAMLQARATAELARLIFADAIGGLAAIEELEDDSGAGRNGLPPELPQEPAAPTRKRRRTQVTAAATPPPRGMDSPHHDHNTNGDEGEIPLPDTPDLPEKEPLEPEPEPPPPMDESTRKRMMAGFRERGFNTSEQRHAFTSLMLGREIHSSVDLNADDAAKMIRILEAAATIDDR